jgi:uncharacterized lipoprotein YbaY
MRPCLAAACLCGVLAAGCSDSVTSPTPVAPIPTALSITLPAGTMLVGQVVVASAVAAMPDGSSVSVVATWTSDNPMVATTNAGGIVTGLSHGRITLVATYRGVTATAQLSVIASYAGRWSGKAVLIDPCTDFLDPRACYGHTAGLLGDVRVALLQAGDTVTGTFDLTYNVKSVAGGTNRLHYLYAVRGRVEEDGTLTLASDTLVPNAPLLMDCRVSPDSSGALAGTFTTALVNSSLSFNIPRRSWGILDMLKEP